MESGSHKRSSSGSQKRSSSGSHKRSLSTLWEEHVETSMLERCSEMDWLELLQDFTIENEELKFPALQEDFHSFMARELGAPNHPWISGHMERLVPDQNEDFVSYFARFNGIADTGVVDKLRQAIVPHSPRPQEQLQQQQQLEIRKTDQGLYAFNQVPWIVVEEHKNTAALDKWIYPHQTL